MTFRQHMRQTTASALAEFPRGPEPGVYIVTFRIDSVGQDPRFPYLALGYNTEDEVARQLAEPSRPKPWEARWNYAYFPPTRLEGIRIIGHDEEHDAHGAELPRQKTRADGPWYEDDAPEHVQDERAELLGTRLRELCVGLARQLHAEGDLVRALGRPVPVLLYDMFDPDSMFTLTEAANPSQLVADFLSEAPGEAARPGEVEQPSS